MNTPEYRPSEIEAKWQARWAADRTNEPDLDRAARPFYNLMMFPYPSAEGLHVGNLFAFTGADVFGRVSFKNHRAHRLEPVGDGGAFEVGTADLVAQVQQNFRNSAHANAADPDEVDTALSDEAVTK